MAANDGQLSAIQRTIGELTVKASPMLVSNMHVDCGASRGGGWLKTSLHTMVEGCRG